MKPYIPVTVSTIASVSEFNRLMTTLDTKKANEAEGFVIKVDNHRFKLKYADYCLVHRMISVFNENAVLEAIIKGSFDDYYSQIPPMYQEACKALAEKIALYDSLVREEVSKAYEIVKDMPVKEAMLWIDKNSVKPVNSLIKSEYLHKEWSPLGVKCRDE